MNGDKERKYEEEMIIENPRPRVKRLLGEGEKRVFAYFSLSLLFMGDD